MKKNTIIAAIAAASAILLCASCQKQELIEQNNGINATGKVFTATIGQGLTKTTITSDFKVNWLLNDEVSINEVKYTATPDASDPTKAALATTEAAPGKLDGKYKALYPYSLIVPAEGQNPAYFAFPATQTYAAGQFNAPMYAESETEVFTFNNICGVLCLSLKGTDKVKSISVTANEAICGKFTMTDAATVNLTGDGKTVTLDCGEGVQLNATTATNFYIYLPPKDSYTAGMKIVATSTEGKTFEKTTAKAVKIEKNNLYTFDWDATFSEPTPPTFKAVYNTNGDANTLTFYYDAVDHSGDGITIYEDGTDNWLFDDSKDNYLKWGYNDKRASIKCVEIDESVKDYKGLTSTAYMFFNMTEAESISGAEYLDVSNVKDMTYMFGAYGRNSTSLTDVPVVSGWKTDNVEKMVNLFSSYGQNSTSLTAPPDVSKWNTGKVTDMSSMFSQYGSKSTSLTAVPDVSRWNTDNVTNMGPLFSKYGEANKNNINCELDLTGWNLAKLTTGNTFYNFDPNTFVVTIPAKTGENANQPDTWYGGEKSNGTIHSFAPPEGKYFIPVLIGVFTVSDPDGTPNSGDEKKIHFSQGNLQATYSATTSSYSCGFAANQYDYIGNAAGNTSIDSKTDGAVVDLFGWSTEKTTYGISISTSSSDYSGDFVDWGKAIGDGNTRRTLTTAEWQYLINVNGNENIRKDKYKYGVTVCDKANCLVLAPDDFTGSIALSYTADTWAAAEAAGLVCLPAAGTRNGSDVSRVGEYGYYWSSTRVFSSDAYIVYFRSSGVSPGGSDSWNKGFSVRLVTDVPAK